MTAPNLNPGDILKDLQQRAEFMLNADKHIADVVEVLKDTHRILAKLEAIVDRADEASQQMQAKLDGFDVARVQRLEDAILNIERATLGLEGAITALPKRWQARIQRAQADQQQA